MKVWIVHHNETYSYSPPFAVFSTKQLAEIWIKNSDSGDLSYGIQELELDYSPEDWMEIEEDETCYMSE